MCQCQKGPSIMLSCFFFTFSNFNSVDFPIAIACCFFCVIVSSRIRFLVVIIHLFFHVVVTVHFFCVIVSIRVLVVVDDILLRHGLPKARCLR